MEGRRLASVARAALSFFFGLGTVLCNYYGGQVWPPGHTARVVRRGAEEMQSPGNKCGGPGMHPRGCGRMRGLISSESFITICTTPYRSYQ